MWSGRLTRKAEWWTTTTCTETCGGIVILIPFGPRRTGGTTVTRHRGTGDITDTTIRGGTRGITEGTVMVGTGGIRTTTIRGTTMQRGPTGAGITGSTVVSRLESVRPEG
jgi:hypothetical protein